MQIDLKVFCSDIRQAEAENCLNKENVSPYLMQNLFIPYITGKDVRLDSLDYDAFTLSDMETLYEYLNDAGNVEQKLEPMRNGLLKCGPVARKIRAFC